jgi:hypothetical protein
MNPTDCIHVAIGLAAALLAGRIGIPLPGISKQPAPSGDGLRVAVREVLLELLRGLSRPRPDEGRDLREALRALVEEKDADSLAAR